MAIELLGAKMIAVFYGNSLVVWTPVLAITLTGLALGYLLGGLVSQRYPHFNTIYYVFLITFVLICLMPFWADKILVQLMVLGYIKGSIFSLLLTIFLPLIFFGMIPPLIINKLNPHQEQTGEASGKVYAISTVGGILATYLTGFGLLPGLGIVKAFIVVAVILGAIPLIYFILNKKVLISAGIIFTAIIFVGIGVSENKNITDSSVKVLYKSNGLLGNVFVLDDLIKQQRSLFINYISQTYMHVPTQRSHWKYIHRISLYSSFKPPGSEVLICGLGGGNLVNEMRKLQFNVDVVELDPRMEMMAYKYFFMTNEVNTVTDDARHYIKTATKKYDIIILDMSAGENQPANVYTLECFNEIRNLLLENGVLFIHYQNVIHGENSLAIRSLGKTLLEAGFQSRLINTDPEKGVSSELMLFSHLSDIDLTAYNFERRDQFADPFNFPKGASIFVNDYDFTPGLILEDDKPVFDLLHANTLQKTRGGALNITIPALLKKKVKLF